MKNINLKIYFLLISFNNLWFITSNWLFFWLKFMGLGDVGLIDSIAFFIGTVFEFPAGIISDKLSRKLSLLISQILSFLGSFIIFLADNKFEIAIGFILFQIGMSFYNSSVEALGYETSVQDNQDYSKILIKSSSLSNLFYIVSLLVGGYFYTINHNIPNFLFSLNFLIGIVLCLFISDQVKIREENSKINFNELSSKFDLKILVYFWFFLAVGFSFDYGFLKLAILDEISTSNDNYFYILFATVISIYLTSLVIPKISNINKTLKILYFILGILLLTSNYLYFSHLLLFFILTFIAIFSNQLFLKYTNERLSDSVRGSAISFIAFLYKFPYVLVALIFGYALETIEISEIYWVLGSILLIFRPIFKFGLKLGYNWIFERGRSSVAE